MPNFLNRVGMRYGRLEVVSHEGKDHRNKHLWLCKCVCGKEKIVVADNLSSKKSKSCGCLRIEHLSKKGNQYGLYLDREDALLKAQYSHLKRRHIKSKMPGQILSFAEFKIKSKSECKYCGLKYSREIEDRLCESRTKKRLSTHILKMNGLDRVNNLIGYTCTNTVPCCKYCNQAKHTMTENDFYKWIKRVYEYTFVGVD